MKTRFWSNCIITFHLGIFYGFVLATVHSCEQSGLCSLGRLKPFVGSIANLEGVKQVIHILNWFLISTIIFLHAPHAPRHIMAMVHRMHGWVHYSMCEGRMDHHNEVTAMAWIITLTLR